MAEPAVTAEGEPEKASQKDKCWACGKSGHQKGDCTATAEEKKAYRREVLAKAKAAKAAKAGQKPAAQTPTTSAPAVATASTEEEGSSTTAAAPALQGTPSASQTADGERRCVCVRRCADCGGRLDEPDAKRRCCNMTPAPQPAPSPPPPSPAAPPAQPARQVQTPPAARPAQPVAQAARPAQQAQGGRYAKPSTRPANQGKGKGKGKGKGGYEWLPAGYYRVIDRS